jgi:outer membrane protein OmpA-like peptidoglycan-associated protein
MKPYMMLQSVRFPGCPLSITIRRCLSDEVIGQSLMFSLPTFVNLPSAASSTMMKFLRKLFLLFSVTVLTSCASTDWTREMQLQLEQLTAQLARSGIIVSRTGDNRIKLHIPSDLSFNTGSSVIQRDFAQYLSIISSSFAMYPLTSIKVIGHTDSTGNDAVNIPLSFDRAESTRNFMVSRGVRPERFQVDGRGSSEPVMDNGNGSGRSMNRRVELYVGIFGHPQSAPVPMRRSAPAPTVKPTPASQGLTLPEM